MQWVSRWWQLNAMPLFSYDECILIHYLVPCFQASELNAILKTITRWNNSFHSRVNSNFAKYKIVGKISKQHAKVLATFANRRGNVIGRAETERERERESLDVTMNFGLPATLLIEQRTTLFHSRRYIRARSSPFNPRTQGELNCGRENSLRLCSFSTFVARVINFALLNKRGSRGS